LTTRPEELASTRVSGRAIEQRLDPGGWDEAIACTEGPQLVIAGPGAGKTEFLVRRIAYLVDHQGVPGSDILSLAFSRRAAADFGNRLHTSVAGSVGGVGASTFHAFAYRLLERYGPEGLGRNRLPSILTGPEQVELVAELLTSDPPHHWPVLYRRLLTSRTLAHEVTNFILRARESMIEPSYLAQKAEEYPDWKALPAFMARYDQELERRERIDYGTLMARAVEVLRTGKAVEDGPAYRYVLVDEYQDSTKAQSALLRELVKEPANLTVAADPYQSIYGFRGADLSNLDRFQEDFRPSGQVQVRRWVLSTSFRTPSEILRAAERLTVGAGLRGEAGPVEPASQPGQVKIRVFGQQSEEAEWIAARAVRLHVEQGVPYSRMAVLVRTKRRLLRELSRALEQRSIPHDRPDMRLADHPATRIFLDLARVAAQPGGSDPADLPIRRLLLGPLFNLGVGGLRALERLRRQLEMTWPQTLRHYVEEGKVLADLLEDPSWTEHTAIDGFWEVWTRLPQLKPLVDVPASREFRAAWSSLAQTLARVADRDPDLTLLDYLRLIESDDFEASPLLSYRDPTEDRMVLTTLHQAKGLEFDVVFIADVVEGVLPDLTRHQSLLRIDRLDEMDSLDADSPSEIPPGSANLARRKRLQEETRLLYTAITRACRRVFITATTAGPDENHRRPSRFLEILGGPETLTTAEGPDSYKPVTFHEAEIWLRRLLVNPAAPEHRRLAAVSVLATHYSSSGIRHPSKYAPLRRAGADQGLLTTGRGLSPTDAVGYSECPRRFAAERLLSARTGDSPYLAFGSLIHKVLENAEQQTISTGQRPDHDQVLALLEAEIEPSNFGTTVEQEAWRRRAEELLNRLFTIWPHPEARPVLLEQWVSMELGGFVWRGRIDRVEQNPDGTLRLVDYKTGKNPPSQAEAGKSLQLGFYYLAANADPTVSRLGSTTEAEFWFPLKPTQRVTTRKFQPDREAEIRADLEQIAQAIRAEDWSPRPGPDCDRCEVRLVCPDWAEGQEAYRR